MAMFVLNRNHTLVSLAGRVVSFKVGQPVWVPPEVEKEALLIGAQPTEGTMDILDPDPEAEPEMSAEDRLVAINNAYGLMKGRDVRGDFTAQGVPNIKVLASLTGFEVTSKERDDTWQAFKEAEAAKAEDN